MSTHACPRRAEHFSPAALESNTDTWREDGTCSFCGSLSGDQFMREVAAGTKIEPTDKDYKAYLDVANPDVGKPVLKEGWANPPPEKLAQIKNDPAWTEVRPGVWDKYGPADAIKHAKFYFQHLSVEQRHQFIELLNAKRVNIGEPGRFYRLPFFITRAA